MTKDDDSVVETRPRRPILSLKLRPANLPVPPSPAKTIVPLAASKRSTRPETAKAVEKVASPVEAPAQPISPKQFHKTLNAVIPVVRKALADETWKDETLLEAYQAAKQLADGPIRKSAKIISRAAVQRGETAGVSQELTDAALRAAYAAAIVSLVRGNHPKDDTSD